MIAGEALKTDVNTAREYADRLEFRALGPLEIRVDGQPVLLGTPKRRKLLALLVLHANRVVPWRAASEELWGDDPPESAASNLRSYAASLRAALPDRGRGRLVARPAGYLLRVGAGETDLCRFSALAEQGRAALDRSDPFPAVRLLGKALDMWRGEALEDVPAGPVLAPMLAVLSERRLTVVEDHAAARLELGEAAHVIPDLLDLLAEHPCRERGWALLISARYSCGDIAGAVQAFSSARSALREELGIEPGEQLCGLQRAILNRSLPAHRGAAGKARIAGRVEERPPTSPRPVPRQLPAPSSTLTGFAAELDMISRALTGPGSANRARVVIVHGQPGSGKSALAITAADQVAPRFPDGQLYADLMGQLTAQTADAGKVAARLLRGLAVQDRGREPGVASARLRSALLGRRLLVVLDNVADPLLVSALVPAESGCAVLVTSSQPLGSVDGATRVAVPELSAAAATRLMLGLATRVCEPEPQHAAVTMRSAILAVQLCGRLPLALQILAARLAGRPDLSLGIVARRLRDERTRLDELCFAGLSVRDSLSRCYLPLTPDAPAIHASDPLAVRLFVILGQLRGSHVNLRLTARLMRESVTTVTLALDRLVAAGLVVASRSSGRYRLPELTRLFAREIAARHPNAEDWLSAPARRYLSVR